MKILSIGNSFSQDAHRYLHLLGKADGVEIKTVNLLIGGCSLQTHYQNMLDDEANYWMEFNGQPTGFKVSIRQALTSDDWDYITLQQASAFSAKEESYFPYIEALAEYVRKYCPRAKVVLHQTWTYEEGGKQMTESDFDGAEEMLLKVHSAYEKAAHAIGADGVIPCGEVVHGVWKKGVRMHRDGLHLALGVGRYAAALTWYAALTGNPIDSNGFDDFELPVSEGERIAVIQTIKDVLTGRGIQQ